MTEFLKVDDKSTNLSLGFSKNIEMAEEINEISVGQFDTVSQLIASSVSLQLAVIGLIIGIILISVVYRKFSFWVKSQKFNHTRPHVARFARKIILPFWQLL